LKVADFLKAGFKFDILLADVHAHLDNQKSPWELLDCRFKYYDAILKSMLSVFDVDTKKLSIVRGSDVQLNGKYMMDLLKLSAINTMSRSRRAAHEVVKFGEEPKLSGFIYPLMQALDEEYLKVDVQLGGLDQRKILMFARETLPKLGYKPRVEVMTPMLPGLTGEKMSSSDEKSKIDVLDSEQDVIRKVDAALCPAGVVEGNGLMMFLKHFLMVLKEDSKTGFVVEREKRFGGNITYKRYNELEGDFINKKLHPADLKKAVAREINVLIEPARKKFANKQDLLRKAYPKSL
jgi:tyrosyl-tRNA synthetase